MNTYIEKLIIRREALIKELHGVRDIVMGSFFKRKVQGTQRYCVSRMVDKKQRQVYVSEAEKDQVQQGIIEYKQASDILRELGEVNLELIKNGVRLKDV